MDAFEIVRLVGVCTAMVVGAIVFLVVFFRGMAWMDQWIKRRMLTDAPVRMDEQRSRRRSKPSPRKPQSIENKNSPVKLALPVVQRPKAARQFIKDRQGADAMPTVASQGDLGQPISVPRLQLPEPKSFATAPQPEIKATDSAVDEEPSIRRIAIHLDGGQILERVSLCSVEESQQILRELGIPWTGFVVLQDEEDKIYAIREQDVRLITCSHVSTIELQQHASKSNAARGNWPVRGTFPRARNAPQFDLGEDL